MTSIKCLLNRLWKRVTDLYYLGLGWTAVGIIAAGWIALIISVLPLGIYYSGKLKCRQLWARVRSRS